MNIRAFIFCSAAVAALATASASPRIAISVNTGGFCRPAPVVICQPVQPVYWCRPVAPVYYYPTPVHGYWGAPVVAYSSPMVAAPAAWTTRVAPSAQPVVVPARIDTRQGSTFRWRR